MYVIYICDFYFENGYWKGTTRTYQGDVFYPVEQRMDADGVKKYKHLGMAERSVKAFAKKGIKAEVEKIK